MKERENKLTEVRQQLVEVIKKHNKEVIDKLEVFNKEKTKGRRDIYNIKY